MASIMQPLISPATVSAARVQQGLPAHGEAAWHLDRTRIHCQTQPLLALRANGGTSGLAARAVAGIAAAFGATGVVISATSRSLRHRRRQTRSARVVVAAESSDDVPEGQSYMPLLVKQENGDDVQIEVRGIDTVNVVKAMLQMQLGIAEDKQELTFADMPLEDNFAVMDYGIQEGSTLILNVAQEAEVEEEEEEEIPVEIDGEPCIRVFVKCEVTVTKTLTIPMDVKLSETVKELKARAYAEFVAEASYMARNSARDYGLFILKHGPTMLERGNLRMLEKDERVADKLTIEESGLKGGEELFCAFLMYAKC